MPKLSDEPKKKPGLDPADFADYGDYLAAKKEAETKSEEKLEEVVVDMSKE